ncbi:maleylpyruvate isomerase family mycothiol-dependent enzyme [Actinomadura alba]|uniref:Maleylpyruvate isomerase family mycothiol-dependent enzyme n=1 Tax=Actinomadura alba TaxID=406431 RepID=A0ABR7LWG8_9ACTN|nr:maleylpyruvate isomerase family mycothiol-dependent enzyme [Actinomadura alba]MBC6469192.1 maleylpyruvate isomerase family mycothiol-dependent enzyme [Actinomadura alba]
MRSASLLLHLRRELDTFQACLSRDLSARIEHCGDWTLHDLADHLGGSNLWAAAAVIEQRGDYKPPAAPRDPAALVSWFEESSATLLHALDRDPGTSAWAFHPPHTVGFWQRRRCLEALVHRWDAEHAIGIPSLLDAELAGEGVAEVFDTMAPRQMARGRAKPPASALRLEATDTGTCWTYGPGVPVATLSATAENLLLLLWGRVRGDSEAFVWEGDQQAGRHILDGPLTA